MDLERFEAFAESVLQRVFAGWLYDRVQLHDLAIQLARAMEAGAGKGLHGEAVAPDEYWVDLRPEDLAALRAEQPAIEEKLTDTIIALAREASLQLAARPIVVLRGRSGQTLHTVTVTARAAGRPDATQAMNVRAAAAIAAETAPPSAYLVVAGRRVVPLTGMLIRLGRRSDNDVIVDDPRVSRHHAQIRLRFGRYVVYDLGSHGGTLVNGAPVTECVLAPGDVLSLAGCDLIYGEDDSGAVPADPDPGKGGADATQPGQRRRPATPTDTPQPGGK